MMAAVGQGAFHAFSRIYHLGPEQRRHTFVAVGWQRTESGLGLEPFYVTISNAQGRDGVWRSKASKDFEQNGHILDGASRALFVAGQPLEAGLERELQKELASISDPRAIAERLADAIRQTAATNPAVGTGLLGVILPREHASKNSTFDVSVADPSAAGCLALPPISGPQAFYVPSPSSKAILAAPHLVNPNYSLTGFHVVAGQTLTDVEIRRRHEDMVRQREEHQASRGVR
jgi:hypothetical protein